MPYHLLISVNFLQPACHARMGKEEAAPNEWPPSPLRLFQAMVAGAAARWASDHGSTRATLTAEAPVAALKWLENLCAAKPPTILAPHVATGLAVPRHVPNNSADLVAAEWARGNVLARFKDRTNKLFRPTHLLGEPPHTVHYLWPLTGEQQTEARRHEPAIAAAARCIVALGWGIDTAIGDARIIDEQALAQLAGERWEPGRLGTLGLRLPVCGTFDTLINRHAKFMDRLKDGVFHPVPSLRVFTTAAYRRPTDPVPRPYAVFKLIDENEDTVSYPHAKLIHIAGMVKHLAIELMKRRPPRDLRGLSRDRWVEQYVAGHFSDNNSPGDPPHARFSYVPLPSIGHVHTNPSVRRVMIIAPVGDEHWLEYLAEHLDGEMLKPDPKYPVIQLPRPTLLQRISPRKKDGVRDAYTRESNEWASVTPVILNRHVDKIKQTLPDGKVIQILDRDAITEQVRIAIAQAGIEQPCEFEWDAFSYFPRMLSAHKYRKDPNDPSKRVEIGYVRPDHLAGRTAVHVRLRFGRRENPKNPNSRWIPADYPVPGPITIGAGRHCGLGLLARVNQSPVQ